MNKATRKRLERVGLAVAVVLAHVGLVYVILHSRFYKTDRDPVAAPVVAMLMDDEPRETPLGSQPVVVTPQPIQLALSLSPKVPDLTADEPVEVSAQVGEKPASTASSGAPSAAAAKASPGSGSLAIVQRVLPKYPAASVRLGEEGSAILQVHVDDKGHVIDVKLSRTSGFKRLDDAALDAVRKWKFAPSANGSQGAGAWGETELRFNLYRFTYSRIGESPSDRVSDEVVKVGGTELATPGGEAALRRFIEDVRSNNVPGTRVGHSQDDVGKIRSALSEWGAVRSVQFSGGVGDHSWRNYDIKPEYRQGQSTGSVSVRWDMYEVRHEKGTSEWRIALDRDGVVWAAQAGAAPWSP